MVHVDNIVGRAELTFWPLSRVGRFSSHTFNDTTRAGTARMQACHLAGTAR